MHEPPLLISNSIGRQIIILKHASPHTRATLVAFDDGQFRAEFTARIGQAAGRKEQRDDHRTPEGNYRICVKNPRSYFHRSLGLSYPNLNDADRALARRAARLESPDASSGLLRNEIDETLYQRIADAHAAHGGSDWTTPLGGEVYIHGDDPNDPNKQHTRGCVCLKNADMDWLFEFACVGTPVTIHPPGREPGLP